MRYAYFFVKKLRPGISGRRDLGYLGVFCTTRAEDRVVGRLVKPFPHCKISLVQRIAARQRPLVDRAMLSFDHAACRGVRRCKTNAMQPVVKNFSPTPKRLAGPIARRPSANPDCQDLRVCRTPRHRDRPHLCRGSKWVGHCATKTDWTPCRLAYLPIAGSESSGLRTNNVRNHYAGAMELATNLKRDRTERCFWGTAAGAMCGSAPHKAPSRRLDSHDIKTKRTKRQRRRRHRNRLQASVPRGP